MLYKVVESITEIKPKLDQRSFHTNWPIWTNDGCPGLARPDIADGFRCDAVLSREERGCTTGLGASHLVDVDRLVRGQFGSRFELLRVHDGPRWWEARCALNWYVV